MPNIKILINGKKATVEGSPVIICGNSDYTVTFTFDDDWGAVDVKTARFVYVKAGEVQHEDRVFSGDTVAVPILSDVAFVKVGVFAGDLCTTTPARVLCDASILCGSGAPQDPTPDVYHQIMEMLDASEKLGQAMRAEVQELAEQVAEDFQSLEDDYHAKVEQGYFTGPKGEKGDQGEKGDTGASGVTVPASGFFTLEVVSETGDLYCVTNSETDENNFTLDEDGNLYYEIKEE